jgi:hypothetical protein
MQDNLDAKSSSQSFNSFHEDDENVEAEKNLIKTLPSLMTGYWILPRNCNFFHLKQYSSTKINILLTLSEVEIPKKGKNNREKNAMRRTQQFNNNSPENICNENIFVGFSVSFAGRLKWKFKEAVMSRFE